MSKETANQSQSIAQSRPVLRRAVYPGTFDPPTRGHMDIARRASQIFDEVVIAVSHNPSKHPLFTLEERQDMLAHLFEHESNIRISSFSSLLVDFVASQGAFAIVRGLRAVSDFEYELQLASMNNYLNRNVETVFFMASDENLFVSSSVIKEISRLGGNISEKVHPYVLQKLQDKFHLKN